jgi:hypothetical protein
MKHLLILLGALVLPCTTTLAQTAVQRSHIEEHVPPADQAETILRRDLAAFFTASTGQKVASLQIVALRDGPTQSGVAYPKFYFWVLASGTDAVLAEGAVRVAAIDQVRFEVTDFLPKAKIQQLPGEVAAVFPQPLVSLILQRAEVKP